MERSKPWTVGFTESRDQFPREVVVAHELRFSQAATLKDLARTYDFYTPALLYLHVRLMDRDPFSNFVQEYGKDVVPVSLRFSKPVFQGLGEGTYEWNHSLYALEKDDFEAFRGWLGTLAFVDRDLKLVTRIRIKQFSIADPLFFERAVVLPAELPMVPITVVCLDTNQGCRYIEPGLHPLLDLPAATFTPKVFRETYLWSQAILGQHPNPYQFMEENLQPGGPSPAELEIQERVRKARTETES